MAASDAPTMRVRALGFLAAISAVIVAFVFVSGLAYLLVPHETFRAWTLDKDSVGGKLIGAIGVAACWAAGSMARRSVIRRYQQPEAPLSQKAME